MKKYKVTLLLLFMLTVLNFEGKSQATSSVIIVGYSDLFKVRIETTHPDYTVEKNKFKQKDGTLESLMKEEMDKWIEKGYYLTESNSTNTGELTYKTMFILIKEEN